VSAACPFIEHAAPSAVDSAGASVRLPLAMLAISDRANFPQVQAGECLYVPPDRNTKWTASGTSVPTKSILGKQFFRKLQILSVRACSEHADLIGYVRSLRRCGAGRSSSADIVRLIPWQRRNFRTV